MTLRNLLRIGDTSLSGLTRDVAALWEKRGALIVWSNLAYLGAPLAAPSDARVPIAIAAALLCFCSALFHASHSWRAQLLDVWAMMMYVTMAVLAIGAASALWIGVGGAAVGMLWWARGHRLSTHTAVPLLAIVGLTLLAATVPLLWTVPALVCAVVAGLMKAWEQETNDGYHAVWHFASAGIVIAALAVV